MIIVCCFYVVCIFFISTDCVFFVPVFAVRFLSLVFKCALSNKSYGLVCNFSRERLVPHQSLRVFLSLTSRRANPLTVIPFSNLGGVSDGAQSAWR